MARTIAEIQADMVTAKEAEAGLSGLTSTSIVAIWRLIFYVCAVAIKVIEDLFDVLEENVEARRLEIPVGVKRWYASESLVYQFGDTLEFADGRLDYEIIDDTKYVVDLSAVDIVNGVTVIKVAKVTAGVAEPLSASELAGFTQYWIEKRFAGTTISIISQDADLLKAYYTVTRDSQVLASDGSLLTDSASFPVEDAINNFLQTFQAENFDGTLQVMSLTDAIQSAVGVTNVVATSIEAKAFDSATYQDVLSNSQQKYVATAGYSKIDPLFPLSTTISYVV